MYSIAARPTLYRSVHFRSRLEARWAAFFDLLKWSWRYEPIDFQDWTPDFSLRLPCGHSECNGNHEFYCEVKPYERIEQFKGHPATLDFYGNRYGKDACLLLGLDPTVAHVDFAHGAGGGEANGPELFQGFAEWNCNWPSEDDVLQRWAMAGGIVQWRPVR